MLVFFNVILSHRNGGLGIATITMVVIRAGLDIDLSHWILVLAQRVVQMFNQ